MLIHNSIINLMLTLLLALHNKLIIIHSFELQQKYHVQEQKCQHLLVVLISDSSI